MTGSVPIAFRKHKIRFAVAGLLLAMLGADLWVFAGGARWVEALESLPEPDFILVPGASVLRNGKPSPVLRQRIESALWCARKWPKAMVVLSGTAVIGGYDEPLSMRNYLVEHRVDSLRLVLDRGGVNTRASVQNLSERPRRVVIVSQRWHLPRAIWLARSAGWEAWGMPAGDEEPSGWGNLAREHLVRMENFWQVLFRRIASLVVSLRSER